jgi:hypothetical protein
MWLLLEGVTASLYRGFQGSVLSGGRRVLRLAVLGLALLSGCSAPRGEGARDAASPSARIDGWEPIHSADGRFSVVMPAPTREKRAQEGPMRACILWGVDSDGTRYEVAYFDMPEPLDAAGRARLLAKVELGLAGGPGIRDASRRDVTIGGVTGLELAVTLPDNRTGKWWIFFLGGERLFQVSGLGPAGERLSAGTATFFESFQLLTPAPPP